MAEQDMTRGWRFAWALMLSKDFLFLSNLVDQVSDSGDKSLTFVVNLWTVRATFLVPELLLGCIGSS